ncbi:helix-turn-helix domain-containing protein [Leucobacter sp. CX87]|uniref:AraC family transcriptional regulator n=1 Tax=unclassified Leucobacter TaxID=2621730 RepID=UPI00333ED51F
MVDEAGLGGILYPTRLPTFHRVPAPTELVELVRWFWIPRWDLAPGRTSRQTILPFPASNLVVGPEGVTLSGPTTGVSHRDLRGKGWAVGALLRPAAAASLSWALEDIADTEVVFEAPELHLAVAEAMQEDSAAARERAAGAFAAWITALLPPPEQADELGNRLEDLIASDRSIVRVDQLAERLAMSTRSVQRLALRTVGLPPLAVIRRYRLQEAAERLRSAPEFTIGQIAVDLGYSDHAHLTADFHRILGITPTAYRRDQA